MSTMPQMPWDQDHSSHRLFVAADVHLMYPITRTMLTGGQLTMRTDAGLSRATWGERDIWCGTCRVVLWPVHLGASDWEWLDRPDMLPEAPVSDP